MMLDCFTCCCCCTAFIVAPSFPAMSLRSKKKKLRELQTELEVAQVGRCWACCGCGCC